jgi:PhnB protein
VKIEMARIHSYLTFSGNCREAMTFYKKCLGGELVFQTLGDSPLSGKMPKQMKDCIVHATLTKNALVLMGSDMVLDSGLVRGSPVSLYGNSEGEVKPFYEELSTGGKVSHPLENTFWGAWVGGLTHKFGNQ